MSRPAAPRAGPVLASPGTLEDRAAPGALGDLPGPGELQELAARLYRELSGRDLRVPVVWNRRLRTSGGRFVVPPAPGGGSAAQGRVRNSRGRPFRERARPFGRSSGSAPGCASDGPRIELNPRYAEAGGPDVLVDVLKHELAHYHLWSTGAPWGHTAEFRALMRAWGFSRYTRPDLLPRSPARWEYICPACGRAFRRRRRYPHAASCSACSPRYDERFRLLEKRIG